MMLLVAKNKQCRWWMNEENVCIKNQQNVRGDGGKRPKYPNQKKKIPVPLCSPQTTHVPDRNWTQASSTRCRRITTWTATRIGKKRNRIKKNNKPSACILQNKKAVHLINVCVCACVYKPFHHWQSGRVNRISPDQHGHHELLSRDEWNMFSPCSNANAQWFCAHLLIP